MNEMTKRSTVYFEPDLHRALRIKAASTHRSLSDVVNEAVRLVLREDQEDLQAFEDRAGEATISYEDLLKDLAEAHDFQVTRGINPNEPPVNSRQEVIVLLKPELNAGNWIRQFTEFKFLLIRRVSEQNMWVIAYDPKQIAEKAVLALFKDAEGVLEVQVNRAVQDRE